MTFDLINICDVAHQKGDFAGEVNFGLFDVSELFLSFFKMSPHWWNDQDIQFLKLKNDLKFLLFSLLHFWTSWMFSFLYFPNGFIFRARENMEFGKGKKEIINSKNKDFVQNHTFYAKKRYILQKVRNAVQKSIQVETLVKVWTMLPYNDIKLKGGDLQNLSKVSLNMCFTADLYHCKSNFEHFSQKFTTGLAKNAKREILSQKKDICTTNMQLHKIPSPIYLRKPTASIPPPPPTLMCCTTNEETPITSLNQVCL